MTTNTIKTELIAQFLKQNKLSKSHFCKMCNISPVTFDKIMANQTNFGIVALFKIARVLGVHISKLVNQDKIDRLKIDNF